MIDGISKINQIMNPRVGSTPTPFRSDSRSTQTTQTSNRESSVSKIPNRPRLELFPVLKDQDSHRKEVAPPSSTTSRIFSVSSLFRRSSQQEEQEATTRPTSISNLLQCGISGLLYSRDDQTDMRWKEFSKNQQERLQERLKDNRGMQLRSGLEAQTRRQSTSNRTSVHSTRRKTIRSSIVAGGCHFLPV